MTAESWMRYDGFLLFGTVLYGEDDGFESQMQDSYRLLRDL
jgi:hypothetical protein